MNRLFSHRSSSAAFRALTLATAVLVFALSVFAASPGLHAWLHAHEHGEAAQLTSFGHAVHNKAAHAEPASAVPTEDDDGCAIVLFAQGVLAVVALVLLRIFARRVVGFVPRFVAALSLTTPRFWLPPLCGPPLG